MLGYSTERDCNLETDDNIAFSLEEKRNICICIFVPVSEHLSKMVTQKEGKLHLRIGRKNSYHVQGW